MYYESYKKKPAKKRRVRRSFGGWIAHFLLKLLSLALVILIVGAGILYALPVSLFCIEPEGYDLSLTDGLPSSRINVLLLGMDVLNDNSQRSDTIIIASIGYQTLKLTSVLRDTVVDIPGHGSGKINAAFSYGGPELVMKPLNSNFDLNIMHYLAVDFTSLVALVDAIGGVEIDISEAEMEQINRNVYNSRRVFRPLGYTATELTQYGEGVHLDGLQALGYARIRKIDSDFVRASRQRTLLNAMIKKVRSNIWNPLMLYRLTDALLNAVQTNLSLVQLISLGEKALFAGEPGQMRMPVDNTYTDNGSTIKIDDRQANIDAFRRFVYE